MMNNAAQIALSFAPGTHPCQPAAPAVVVDVARREYEAIRANAGMSPDSFDSMCARVARDREDDDGPSSSAAMLRAARVVLADLAERDRTVAETILAQLGVMAQMEFAVIRRNLVRKALGGVALSLGGCAETRGRTVVIVLDYSDTYTVEVIYRGRKVYSIDGVYCDVLADVIRRHLFGK